MKSKYLTNIKTVPTTLKIMTNVGLLTTNQQGHLNKYRNVWYQFIGDDTEKKANIFKKMSPVFGLCIEIK